MQIPTAPLNGVSQYLFPFHVNQKLYNTWFPLTYFEPLTSESMMSPVYNHVFKAGDGFEFRVGKLNPMDWTSPVTDQQQVRGFAQTQSVDYDSVSCTKLSYPQLSRDVDLMKLGTPAEILPADINDWLTTAQSTNFSWSMFNAATWGNYGMTSNAAGGLVNGAMPVTNRAVAGNLDPANAGDGVYAYNAGATINAQLLAAMPDARAANHKLSAAHLRRLKITAELGGTALGLEDPIRPATVTKKNGQNSSRYYYFADPQSITDLMNDPTFKEVALTRGAIVSPDQPDAINGADYIGRLYNIDIFECPLLTKFRLDINAAGGTDTAWNLFFGAGAWCTGWYKYPYVVRDLDIIEDALLYCAKETRGQKALKFASKVTAGVGAEQGILHSFVRI